LLLLLLLLILQPSPLKDVLLQAPIQVLGKDGIFRTG
jgi:hypothetical protein